MSNPHDDPGHRPPPPRQGEPASSYHDGPLPYQYESHQLPYQTDPHHYQPPPGGQWQQRQPPSGYSAVPPTGGGGYERGRGLLGNLFDFSFDRMVTPQMVRGSYFFALLFTSMSALLWLIVGFWLFQYGWLLTVFIVLFTPPMWLLSMIAIRMFLEFVINQFKITEHLKALREREGQR